MTTKAQYDEAVKQKEAVEKVIQAFHKERLDAFKERLQSNPVFTDDELSYSAIARCSCGAGLAHPKECGPTHYWSCAAILKGEPSVAGVHTPNMPFAFYSILSEVQPSAGGRTTRP